MWKVLGTTVLAALVAGAVSASLTYKMVEKSMRPSAYPEVIRAQRVELYDDNGKPRAFLGFHVPYRPTDMPLLMLSGPNLEAALEMTVYPNDQGSIIFSEDHFDGRMVLGHYGTGDYFPLPPSERVLGLAIHGGQSGDMGFGLSDAGDHYVSSSRILSLPGAVHAKPH